MSEDALGLQHIELGDVIIESGSKTWLIAINQWP
jgi:hypothetical protein